MRSAGGEVYAITSEPQDLASRAQEDWDLPFECVGDPHHEISDLIEERGWLSLRKLDLVEFLDDNASWDVKHPKGIFQPGVLVLSRDERVLYRWRSVPTRANVGGASQRPTAAHVWEQVQIARAQPEGSADVPHDDEPVLDAQDAPFALFVALLMANGWFLRPVPFIYQGDGRDPRRRIRWMFPRLIGFVAAWVLAFVMLPTLWAAVALALYLPIAVRGVRYVYTRFDDQLPGGGGRPLRSRGA